MKYYLGLDNGGTSTKAALFTKDGTQLAVESIATAALTPAPDLVERDMVQMWDDNCLVIQRLLSGHHIDPKDIAGIGLCGHGKGLYLWGKNGKPARNGILSSDNRAWQVVAGWKADGTEEKAFSLSCQHIMACQPVALLAYLRDHEKEVLNQTQWIFACKDYIRFRLTGKARAELTDASGSGLLNLHTADYDLALLQLFGIEGMKDALPPLCQSIEIAGAVSKEAALATGLREGTPVIGGMFDIDACALAVDVTDEKNICMIAGTWSINEYLRPDPITDGRVLMNSLFCLPNYFLIEESSPTSAGNNEWFINQLLPELKQETQRNGTNIYEVMNEWCSEFNPSDFVPVFLPFLSASNVNPLARAAFVGLDASHTRHHLLRSVYEGIAFSHRWHLDKLLSTREAKENTIRLAGGAARSRVWTQMFADVMNLPVETVSVSETGALGCAIALAAALGDYSDLSAASRHMCRIQSPVLPNPSSHEAYEKKYKLYQKTIAALDNVWEDMQTLISRG